MTDDQADCQIAANWLAYQAGLDAAGSHPESYTSAALEFSTKPEFRDLDRAWLVDQWIKGYRA